MAGSLENVYHSIKAALDIFKTTPQTVDVPGKQPLVQAAERIKNDAAKIGLMCSGSSPAPEQLQSLAVSLQHSCVAFCSICHAATAAAGPSYKNELVNLAQGVVIPCLSLVKELACGQALKTHVGLVWDGVAAVSKASADNKACMFKGVAATLAVLKDTVREMDELQEQQQQQHHEAGSPIQPAEQTASSNNDKQPTSSSSQPSCTSSSQDAGATLSAAAVAENSQQHQQQNQHDVDLDFEAGEMSSMEQQVLTSSLQLLTASINTIKAFGKALLQGPTLSVGSDQLDSWESCLFHARHLRRAGEDLGAAMYPPQDFEEVGSAALALFEVTELMTDECPNAEAVGPEQLSSLASQLKAAHEQLREVLGQAQQEANNADSD
eukprot:GHRR01012432.1.p1 GENE.GHRR01012432.1~~GHRR01012432.1.p1  ORF type:complete len:380 (+),score=184.22 GHRR01012432.1:128-1267(+)